MGNYTQPTDIVDVKQYQYVGRQLRVYVYYNREYIPLNCNTVTNSPTTDPNTSYVTLNIVDSVDNHGLVALTSGENHYKELVVIQSSTFGVPFRCVRYTYNTDNVRIAYDMSTGCISFSQPTATVVATLHFVKTDHHACIPKELQHRNLIVAHRKVDDRHILDNIGSVPFEAEGLVMSDKNGVISYINEPLVLQPGQSSTIVSASLAETLTFYMRKGVPMRTSSYTTPATLLPAQDVGGIQYNDIRDWYDLMQTLDNMRMESHKYYGTMGRNL